MEREKTSDKLQLSVEERIYGLSLLWREAEYNFAYWDELPEVDWNARYREFLPIVMAAEDSLVYYTELMRFLAVLRDGHTYVRMPEELKPPYIYKFGTTYAEGRHLLWGKPKSCEVPLLSRIVAVNGTPVEEYVEKYILPYFWHENMEHCFAYSLLGYVISCRESGDVKLETDGGDLILTQECEEEEVYAPWLVHQTIREAKRICDEDYFTVRIFDDNMAYIRVDTFADGEVMQALLESVRQCADCRAFLIDVRKNQGGSGHNARALAEVFFEETIPDTPDKSPVNIANYRAYGQYRNLDELDMQDAWEKKIYDVCRHRLYDVDETEIPVKKSTITFRQPVAVLAGADTASAAESFLTYMKHKNRAAIIGQNSAGTNGQPYMGQLPGGGAFGICTMKCFLLDGTSYNNVGIAPDIYVENRIEDRKAGFDRAMDEAIRYLRETVAES